MQYAPEFHTALITVSSIFIAVAGIMLTILVSTETLERVLKRAKLPRKLYMGMLLTSILFGAASIILALAWFVSMNKYLTEGAMLTLTVQAIDTFILLWRLIGHFDEPEQPKKKDLTRADSKG